ncbi:MULTISPECIES: hypothetical protein [Haloferax]|uniref:Uncharacterized protein n=1 Tax=Haloferax volcanii JCM 10717 TaxID=1227458 RepID=M0I9P5_HALVO|nr:MULTISPECIES: hypothetical protein [Haloferax]ELZ92553.1 hypothetical protein C452_08043 [Haloferax alexandrinus JCM 10717]MBC9985377.1 hypothetical protein [Haloferax sp. AS1]RDZ37077.1 hypothetical protein C5B88_03000 [Haloferax sp. Atlit-24N]RLM37874.1 hypothetical protein DVK03_03000 [Haloferax sp. Atlit-109R]RLM45819.1 hypothetical protein DVK04_03015 [Haloferax sp. Atlit-105R]
MSVGGLVFFLFALLSIGAAVALYAGIQAETRDPPTMSREEAERRARDEGRRYNEQRGRGTDRRPSGGGRGDEFGPDADRTDDRGRNRDGDRDW